MVNNMSNNFSTNINELIRIYGIKSQNRLAEMVDIDTKRMSIIMKYNKPSESELKKLSDYFLETPEMLLYGDFSDVRGEKKDPDCLYRNFSKLFPIFMSERSRSNLHFKKAFDEQRKIYERLEKLFYYLEDIDFDLIFDEYEKAVEDDGSLEGEALGNILSIIFVIIVMGRSKSILSSDFHSLPILVKKEIMNNDKKRYAYHMHHEEIEKGEQEYRKMVEDPEFIDMLYELYYHLKSSADWSDLADYYISLQYIWGAVKNVFSYAQNMYIGKQLLITFANCGNPYAEKYLLTMFVS